MAIMFNPFAYSQTGVQTTRPGGSVGISAYGPGRSSSRSNSNDPSGRFSVSGVVSLSGSAPAYGQGGGALPQDTVSCEKQQKKQQIRRMVREMRKTPEEKLNPYAVTTDNILSIFDQSKTSETEEEESTDKPVNYNYKEVANKIQRAKNSVSAGQAVLSAKRKVMEVKRKISLGEGDPEELQITLTHARRMEMAARKKKHHLELEELVSRTQKSDENKNKTGEAAVDMKNALVSLKEEEISEQEDKILEEREAMIGEAVEQMTEASGEGLSAESDVSETVSGNVHDLLADLNEMISEFGEEELKKLEETMEMLETMEIVDPHMSEEDLEELKRKHRNSERKAIVKADMDYLKDMIKHMLEKGSGVPGMGGNNAVSAPVFPVPAETKVLSPEISMPSSFGTEGAGIDIKL
ncbi:MAG: hypothetical protein K6E33_08295 [Lachnospiraceae bacterium]|nr:hypothetical protein [Lachnospiraceae bacterium]